MANDDFVEELFFRCLDAEDFETALAETCASHPEHAPTLRRRHAALQEVGLEQPAQHAGGPGLERLGSWRLRRLMGRGGMGLVYLAEDEATGRQVALKLIQPDQAWLPGRRERFRREAAVLARLHHPGIVHIEGIGEHAGIPYLAMELVGGSTLAAAIDAMHGRDPARLEGSDLQHWLGSGGEGDRGADPLLFTGSWTVTAARIVHAMAVALAHAHACGVLHRDVKPGNVLITPAGRVVLIDFGLARDMEETTITVTGANVGSLPYMAPEIVAGGTVGFDPRIDVYAAGVLLYELLVLRTPFRADSVEGLRARILAGEAPGPRSSNPDIPRDLETVCLKAMATDPARRYQDAAALAADLANVLAMRPPAARPSSRFYKLWRRARRRPLLAAALISAACAGVLAVPAAIYWRAHAAELAAGAAMLRQEQYDELLSAGFQYLETLELAAALQTFGAAARLSGDDVIAAAGQMLVHLAAHRPAAALQIGEQFSGLGRRQLGWVEVTVLEHLGRTEDAARLRATLPPPSEPAELFLAGRSRLQTNEAMADPDEFRAALEMISRAVALSTSQRLPFWCDLVHASSHVHDVRVAREAVEVLQRRWPHSIRAWLWIGVGKELFDRDGAIAAYRHVLAMAPDFVHARHNLAQLLFKAGDLAAAQAEAKEMLAIAPDHAETWIQIGLTSDAAGDYPRALAAYRRAVELAPEHSNAVLNLGVCERRAGNAAEAERLFLRASELSAGSAPPYACYAAVLIDSNRVEQALPAARKAVALDPGMVFGQRVLARTLMLHGDAAEALVALQAVIRLEPATELTHQFAREMLEKIATPADVAAEDERYRRIKDAADKR